jgi:hypothetical protein
MPTLEVQEELKVEVKRLWKASKDADSLLPKLVPEFIRSHERLQGDGGPGTVRIVHFGPGIPQATPAKEHIDLLDDTNYTMSYTVIEGVGHQYSLLKPTITFTPGVDATTTVAKWSMEYQPVGEQGPPEAARIAAVHVFKAMEAYLLSDPSRYLK